MFSLLEASRAGSAGSAGAAGPLDTASGFNAVITGGTWALLLAGVLGMTVSSGEFRHSTATLTYLASLRRDRVLVAKAVAAGIGAVFGLVGYLIAAGAGLAFVASRGYHVPVGDATMARYAVGHAVGAALLAVIGAGLGSLIRSHLGAVTGVFVWAIVLESLVGNLFKPVQP